MSQADKWVKNNRATKTLSDAQTQQELMAEASRKRISAMLKTASADTTTSIQKMTSMAQSLFSLSSPFEFFDSYKDYVQDASQRAILTLDALRKSADLAKEHQESGAPPVLYYQYETILRGRELPRPSNYVLLKIIPAEGQPLNDEQRPFVIIDPRAGHGPGIGGFKSDSQVGVALAKGHPVYFVAFEQQPEENQTIADVTYSEAMFLEEIISRHPNAAKPIVIGNCQGGWATAVLAATHPDLPGPIVLNGAPMSYWGGKMGEYPMRYSGGVAGGVTPALLSADLGGGIFDGANLVVNFEGQNPGRTWFSKYYELFRNIDDGEQRFLEFERWWSAFYLMTDKEISWIVENLFVGNRLAAGKALLEPGVPINLKNIESPIICFASHGDNITPPAQALNWILDTYQDETEIAIEGQRIIYLVHKEVGHLGIFVASNVAKKEHKQLVSTLEIIESFPPGLYEMMIVDHQGSGIDKEFEVSFAPRCFQDIINITGQRRDEAAFQGVARASEVGAEMYRMFMQPWVQTLGNLVPSDKKLASHPSRIARQQFSSDKPLMQTVKNLAAQTTAKRKKLGPDNPFAIAESLYAHWIETGYDLIKDSKEFSTELSFLTLWANPIAIAFGEGYLPESQKRVDFNYAATPKIKKVLGKMEQGGVAAGIVRLLLLLAGTRDDLRLDRLERSSVALVAKEPFASMDNEARAQLIYEQQIIVKFAFEEACSSLPKLIKTKKDKTTTKDIMAFVLGPTEEFAEKTKQAWEDVLAFLES